MKIAIIDNDRAFLRSLELLLSGYGHEVTAFYSPIHALEKLPDSGTPDLVMSDYRMPEMNGTQFLDKLSLILPGNPMKILMSAHTDLFSETDIAGFGADHFIAKPIGLTRLLALLKEIKQSTQRNPGAFHE